ncbi:MAG: N-methyl-L-tryptophan oxidase [Candidatus Promineifilaceae bacterium]
MSYDTIVIGLGGMGSAALYQLAKRGANVLGIDRFDPPHTNGSTHGESRVTRLAVGEGPEYVPLVARTHEIWHELTSQTGNPMLYESGGYIICPKGGGAGWHHGGDFVQRSAELAQQYGVPHEVLSAAEVRHRHPLVRITDKSHAYFEPSGGIVDPEVAIRGQLGLARTLGAEIRPNERVLNLKHDAHSVTVTTDQGSYRAENVIVSAGAWVHSFLPKHLQAPLGVYRQVMYWFEVEDLDLFSVENFPFLLWIDSTKEDYFGAFPIAKGHKPAIKLLTEQFHDPCDPDTVPRSITQAEIEAFADRFIPRNLLGVTKRCIGAEACLYTVTADEHFIIDWHPDSERVLIVSPCSGHGFKHSAAIGESAAQLMLENKSTIDLSSFNFARFNK